MKRGTFRQLSYQEKLDRLRVKQGKKPSRIARSRPLKAKRDAKLSVWSRAVRKRDGNRCQWPGGCTTGDTRIDPHHIAKRSQRPDLKYSIENAICLCRTHHQWTDDNHDAAVAMKLLSTESYEAAQKVA